MRFECGRWSAIPRCLPGRCGDSARGSTSLRFDRSGSRLASSGNDQTVLIWNLDGPPDADPLELRPGDVLQMTAVAFHPGGRWVATADISGVAVWPFAHRYASILRGHASKIAGLAIAPDGSWVATSSWDSTIRVWPLSGDSRATRRTVPNNLYQLAAHPSGRFLLGGDMMGKTHLIPIGEGETRELGGFTSQVFPVAFSPDGRLAAAGGGQDNPQDGVVRVWDLEVRGRSGARCRQREVDWRTPVHSERAPRGRQRRRGPAVGLGGRDLPNPPHSGHQVRQRETQCSRTSL